MVRAGGHDRKPTTEEALAPPDKRPWTEYDVDGNPQKKPSFKACAPKCCLFCGPTCMVCELQWCSACGPDADTTCDVLCRCQTNRMKACICFGPQCDDVDCDCLARCCPICCAPGKVGASAKVSMAECCSCEYVAARARARSRAAAPPRRSRPADPTSQPCVVPRPRSPPPRELPAELASAARAVSQLHREQLQPALLGMPAAVPVLPRDVRPLPAVLRRLPLLQRGGYLHGWRPQAHPDGHGPRRARRRQPGKDLSRSRTRRQGRRASRSFSTHHVRGGRGVPLRPRRPWPMGRGAALDRRLQ